MNKQQNRNRLIYAENKQQLPEWSGIEKEKEKKKSEVVNANQFDFGDHFRIYIYIKPSHCTP